MCDAPTAHWAGEGIATFCLVAFVRPYLGVYRRHKRLYLESVTYMDFTFFNGLYVVDSRCAEIYLRQTPSRAADAAGGVRLIRFALLGGRGAQGSLVDDREDQGSGA